MLTPAMRATYSSPTGKIEQPGSISIVSAIRQSRLRHPSELVQQQLPENGLDPVGDRVHLGGAIDAPQDAAGAVIGQERSSLPAVDREPRLDRLRAVVG